MSEAGRPPSTKWDDRSWCASFTRIFLKDLKSLGRARSGEMCITSRLTLSRIVATSSKIRQIAPLSWGLLFIGNKCQEFLKYAGTCFTYGVATAACRIMLRRRLIRKFNSKTFQKFYRSDSCIKTLSLLFHNDPITLKWHRREFLLSGKQS